jgi:hypothetical protein
MFIEGLCRRALTPSRCANRTIQVAKKHISGEATSMIGLFPRWPVRGCILVQRVFLHLPFGWTTFSSIALSKYRQKRTAVGFSRTPQAKYWLTAYSS